MFLFTELLLDFHQSNLHISKDVFIFHVKLHLGLIIHILPLGSMYGVYLPTYTYHIKIKNPRR